MAISTPPPLSFQTCFFHRKDANIEKKSIFKTTIEQLRVLCAFAVKGLLDKE
jgi:hypothetical protein